ncbi:MAG TPA: SgrR family transcriptional regulator [Gaiellaceae bacterium]|nr:SgrR family transcriptional regulator [Gaiellaceae bacterium]
MGAERVSYRDAGAAMREALGRAGAADLSLADRKVLDAVLAATVSYSKLWDQLPLAQIAEAAACSTRQARRSLQRLSEAGIVVYVPGRGSGNLSRVGLPEERGQIAVRFPASESGRDRGSKGDRSSTKKGTATRARVRTEKGLPEKGTPSISPPSLSLVLRGEVLDQDQVLAVRVLAAFNAMANAKFEAGKWREMIDARIREHPAITFEEHRAIIERNLAAPWWDTLSPSVIYANAAQFERAMHSDGRRRARATADHVGENLRWLESLRDKTSDEPFALDSPRQNR